MITFLVCLALLVTAYFTYGRYLERLVGIDPAARTPCSRLYDGVDYVPLPRWRIFLIQLLNIAGLGPIFGAVRGAAYGPVAFLWITFGGIFMGAAHDFIAGVISLRHDGASLPETAGVYLGGGMKIVMRRFSAGLMILVGAVFLSQPASLVAARLDVPSLEGIAFGGFSWLLLIVLFCQNLSPLLHWALSLLPWLSQSHLFLRLHSLVSFSALAAFGLSILTYVLLYTFVPGGRRRRWDQLPGALFTAVVWFVFSSIFTYYIRTSWKLSYIYGSLTSIILVILWLNVSINVMFLGAGVNGMRAYSRRNG